MKQSAGSYLMSEAQYDSVLALSSEDRLFHFIKKVVGNRQVWGAKNSEGWLTPLAPEGFTYLPVWPHPTYATRITETYFPGHEAAPFDLETFTEYWLPLLGAEGDTIAVFPGLKWTFWVIEPKDLTRYLHEEMQKYE